jgi:TIR domain
MADIFISYSRTDRERARVFAEAFSARGWTVWWDPEISYGAQFDQVIEHEIGQAKCVVVLWSRQSAESAWVRTEASEANRRGILIPIRIEANATEPLEFRKLQTADLAEWNGDTADSTCQHLFQDIKKIIQSTSQADDARGHIFAVKRPAWAAKPSHRLLVHCGFIVAPTLIAVIVAVIGMRVYRPTQFDFELTLKRLSFVSAQAQNARLLEKTDFSSLALHGIENGTLSAKSFMPFHAGQEDAQRSETSLSSALTGRLRITATGKRGATVMLEGAVLGAATSGEIDRLFVPPGARVEVEVTPEKPPGLSVRILDRPSRITFLLSGEWLLDLVEAKIDSRVMPAKEADATTFRLLSADDGSLAELISTTAGSRVILTAPSGTAPPSLLPAPLRVSALDLAAQGPLGEPLSTVSGEGRIAYVGLEAAKGIDVKTGDFVVFRDLQNFYIRSVDFQPEPGMLRLLAGGVAGSLQSGPAGGIQERALTWFDWLWQQPRSVQLFALVVWLFPTTLAGYKLLKELRQ